MASTEGAAQPSTQGSKGHDLGVLVMLIAAETVVKSCVVNKDAFPVAVSGATTPDVSSLPITPTSGTEDNVVFKGSPEAQRDVSAFNAQIVGAFFEFLPWRSALKTRQVCKLWYKHSSSIVTVHPMGCGYAPFVVYQPPTDVAAMADERRMTGQAWHCAVCGVWNAETRSLCGNRACQAASPAHQDCQRLFLGQLRRDHTVSFVKWLVEDVLLESKQGALQSVQNHQNAVTSRGKGCAWAYVSASQSKSLLGFHRRVYLDAVNGTEGVWIVAPGAQDILFGLVEAGAYNMMRPKHLPRSALVVEVPCMHQAPLPPYLAQPPSYAQTVAPVEVPARFRFDPYSFESVTVSC